MTFLGQQVNLLRIRFLFFEEYVSVVVEKRFADRRINLHHLCVLCCPLINSQSFTFRNETVRHPLGLLHVCEACHFHSLFTCRYLHCRNHHPSRQAVFLLYRQLRSKNRPIFPYSESEEAVRAYTNREVSPIEWQIQS